jgi:hypothetical protein
MRSSSELPDDVGFVFMTAVSGSKFKVIGRRDPNNGELCAGLLMMVSPGEPTPSESNCPLRIEFVTGPEAEQLVAEAVSHATAIAYRLGVTLEEFVKRHQFKGEFSTVMDD